METKSILARLLARENITVQHTSDRTASFDVKNRILALPQWKDSHKDLYDMLVGHEVGHALYTPAGGWRDAQVNGHIPGGYLNVVEDIRIERLIQEQYPGMVRSFKGGYNYLNDSDFFELDDADPNGLGLIDRINIKAKLRDLVDIYFSSEEQPLVDQAFACKTFDDVIESARALHEYVKEHSVNDKGQDDGNEQQQGEGKQGDGGTEEAPPETDESGDSNSSGDGESEDESSDKEGSTEGDSKDADQDDASENLTDPDAQDGARGSESNGDNELQTNPGDPNRSKTDEALQKNNDSLLDTDPDGKVPMVINGMNRKQLNSRLVPYSKLKAERDLQEEATRANLWNHCLGRYPNNPQETYNWFIEEYEVPTGYDEFIQSAKPVVNHMAREFEQRKAAYRYSRSSTAKSGSIDLQQLHAYKTSDDIFCRVTQLADAKSHGMVILLDNSASMGNVLPDVVSQILTLTMFCNRVNIPYEVYSFTNGNPFSRTEDARQRHDEAIAEADAMPKENIEVQHLKIVQVLSSSLNRRQYDQAARDLYAVAKRNDLRTCGFDRMSGTPLNEVLSGMHMLISDFKKKHQLERVIFTTITDGDSAQITSKQPAGYAQGMHKMYNGFKLIPSESKKFITYKNAFHSVDITTKLLKFIKSEIPGVINLGYFIADDNSDINRSISRVIGSQFGKNREEDPYKHIRKYKNQVRREKFAAFDKALGYDRYFVLNGSGNSSLAAEDDEFEVKDNASKKDIRKAFQKYSSSKKTNRVLATKFAEVVS